MNELGNRIGGVDGLVHLVGQDPQNQHLRCLDMNGWLMFLVCNALRYAVSDSCNRD